MRNISITIVLFTVILVSMNAYAIDISELPQVVPYSYVGWASAELPMDVAYNTVLIGCQQFYKIEGRWPNNWYEVRNNGIVQVDLIAPNGDIIDPDDGSLDFMWDCLYSFDIRTDGPTIIKQTEPNSQQGVPLVINQPEKQLDEIVDKYNQALTQAYGSNASMHYADWILYDQRARQLVAMMMTANRMILAYRMHTGKQFASPEEFFASGWNNFDHNSINPLVGDRVLCDGSANQLSWNANGGYFTLVNADGVVCLDVTNGF